MTTLVGVRRAVTSPAINPSLFFDFRRGSLAALTGAGLITFTRATTATYFNSSGLLATAASGEARFEYDPVTLLSRGLWPLEPAATQLVTPTASIRDMTDASWIKITTTAALTATGIDGVVNSASTLTATGVNSTILQTLVAAASSRTYSAWVRRKTGSGTILLKQGTATEDITSQINSTTYTLVDLNDNELNVAYGFQINTSGDEIEVDCNQFEAGAVATSRILTAAGTRNADVAAITPLGSWFNAVEGTIVLDHIVSTGEDLASSMVFSFSDGTANELIELFTTPSAFQFSVIDGGISQLTINTGVTTVGQATKIASTYKVNDFAISVNGAAVGTDVAGTLPTVDRLYVGCRNGASFFLYGGLRTFAYYPRRLSNAELQRLSA